MDADIKPEDAPKDELKRRILIWKLIEKDVE